MHIEALHLLSERWYAAFRVFLDRQCTSQPVGVVLPRTAEAAPNGDAAGTTLQDMSPSGGAIGDESPTGEVPMYANVPASPFAWDPESEERFARFVSVRISVRRLLGSSHRHCRS